MRSKKYTGALLANMLASLGFRLTPEDIANAEQLVKVRQSALANALEAKVCEIDRKLERIACRLDAIEAVAESDARDERSLEMAARGFSIENGQRIDY